MKKGKIAVLLSGRGSNFEALYRNSLLEKSNFEISVVVSDKKEARGLAGARELQLPAYYVRGGGSKDKSGYEKKIVALLREHQVELVCLAGYMRIVGETLLGEYHGRIINIHPSLLPSFPGLNGQAQALDYGVKVSGCTVHFVDRGMDTGPIILQRAVKVNSEDDEESLSARILKEEHLLYSEVVTLFFEKRLKICERKVIILP